MGDKTGATGFLLATIHAGGAVPALYISIYSWIGEKGVAGAGNPVADGR
jgi:hypothetical protein